ncbi:MAG: hydrogenase maturation protease, partial [Bacteroidota bacterium]
FPQQLSAHEIGLKDLIESCGLLGNVPIFHLIAISVSNFQEMGLDLSPEVHAAIPFVKEQVHKLVVEISSSL